MFEKWLKVCKLNKALEDRVNELLREKEEMKRAMINLELQIDEKEKKQVELKAELVHTQKTLKMMSSGTSKLEHILSMGKASGDHHGLRYTTECSMSKIVFVKGHAASEPQLVVKKNVSEF